MARAAAGQRSAMPYVGRMEPEYPRYDAPPPTPTAADNAPAARTARTPILLLVALLTELVVLAAVDNTWVADKIFKTPSPTRPVTAALDSDLFKLHMRESLVVFRWRFTPGAGDHQHIWLAEILAIAAVLVVSLLLIAAVVRGAITFWRAFFGTWTAVIVAALVAAVVRAAVVDERFEAHSSRLDQAVFQGPNALWIVAGVLLGVIVALVVAVFAVAIRRRPAAGNDVNTAMPDPYAQSQSPFFTGPASGAATPETAPRPWPEPASQPTTQLPRAEPAAPPASEATTQLPRAERAEPTEGHATTQLPRFGPAFPRPPDDEDLGHLETEA